MFLHYQSFPALSFFMISQLSYKVPKREIICLTEIDMYRKKKLY